MKSQIMLLYDVIINSNTEIMYNVNPFWIYNKDYCQIFKYCWQCHEDGKPVNMENIQTYINDNGAMARQKNAMLAFLKSLESKTIVPPTNIDEILKSEYMEWRQVELSKSLLDPHLSHENKTTLIKNAYEDITCDVQETDLYNAHAEINKYIDLWEAGKSHRFHERSIDVRDIEHLSMLYGNYIRPVLITIAGLPGFGKTIFAIDTINHLEYLNKNVLVFSIEDPKDVWISKILSHKCSISSRQIMDCDLMDVEKREIKRHKLDESKNRIWLCDRPMTKIDFERFFRRCFMIRNYDCVVVDYTEKFIHNRRHQAMELADIVDLLRRLTVEYSVPIIQFAQLEKSLNDDGRVRPRIKHLYGSSEYDKSSRRICLIGGEKTSQERDIYVDKSTYTAQYTFKVLLDKECNKVECVNA